MKHLTLAENIHWLGHDAMRIDGDPCIYFDPYEIGPGPTADLMFISHEHYDHCSIDDIKKVMGPETLFITEKDSAAKMIKALGAGIKERITVMTPGDTQQIKGVKITAVPGLQPG